MSKQTSHRPTLTSPKSHGLVNLSRREWLAGAGAAAPALENLAIPIKLPSPLSGLIWLPISDILLFSTNIRIVDSSHLSVSTSNEKSALLLIQFSKLNRDIKTSEKKINKSITEIKNDYVYSIVYYFRE